MLDQKIDQKLSAIETLKVSLTVTDKLLYFSGLTVASIRFCELIRSNLSTCIRKLIVEA